MPTRQQLAAFETQLANMLKGDGFKDVVRASLRITTDLRPGLTCEVCGQPIETSRLEFRESTDLSRWRHVHLNRPWCRKMKIDPPSPDPAQRDGAWFNRVEKLYRNASL